MNALYTTETLAEYLQVSPHTVRREREAGRLPFIRIRDLIRYRPEDVEAYLANQAQDQPPVHSTAFTHRKAVGQ